MNFFNAITRFAATDDAKINPGSVGIPHVEANVVLQNGLNIVYFAAGVICIIVLIIGAITYTTSAGASDAVTRAKNMILYSVIGLVVVFMAFGLTWFIIGRIS
jgi:energy-converting hydrogenase Eha subunit E